jgi:hypothetical protein
MLSVKVADDVDAQAFILVSDLISRTIAAIESGDESQQGVGQVAPSCGDVLQQRAQGGLNPRGSAPALGAKRRKLPDIVERPSVDSSGHVARRSAVRGGLVGPPGFVEVKIGFSVEGLIDGASLKVALISSGSFSARSCLVSKTMTSHPLRKTRADSVCCTNVSSDGVVS